MSKKTFSYTSDNNNLKKVGGGGGDRKTSPLLCFNKIVSQNINLIFNFYNFFL